MIERIDENEDNLLDNLPDTDQSADYVKGVCSSKSAIVHNKDRKRNFKMGPVRS